MVTPMPHGYLSDTEYPLQEEHADAIIRTIAYHREDFSHVLIWFSPEERANMYQSIATPFQRTPIAGPGSLHQLPLELLDDILLHLDLQSLLTFRKTSLGSRHVVDSLKQYRIVVSYGQILLCTLLRTKLAVDTSLLDCYNALCTKVCAFCEDFGGFISLFIWKRCCVTCLVRAPETEVLTLATARKHFKLTKAEVRRLRSFRALSGIRSVGDSACRARVAVVSAFQARRISTHPPYPPAVVERVISEQRQELRYIASCALPYYDRLISKAEDGISCAGCQVAVNKDIFPPTRDNLAFRICDRMYAEDDFLAHFRWCKHAQLLWESSDQGRILPAELPEVARLGGYFKDHKR